MLNLKPHAREQQLYHHSRRKKKPEKKEFPNFFASTAVSAGKQSLALLGGSCGKPAEIFYWRVSGFVLSFFFF
jgi:hypothetical protein